MADTDFVTEAQINALTTAIASALTNKLSTAVKPVVVATTANITLSNTQTIDGYALSAGQRVLVKNQTTQSQNGIYNVVSGGAWTRASDFDTSVEASASIVGVQRGTLNGGKFFTNTFTAGSILGTNNMVWTELDPSAVATHIADGTGAHAASAISVADSGTIYTATDVEGALAEVKTLADALDAAMPANPVESTTITTITTLSQAAYDALGTPDANTLYVIV